MLDFENLEKYRENNRIEAKKALGGLPRSIWETYSAFANTLGGILLLGVEEHADKSLHAVNLPNPEKLVKEFWDIVNNPDKVNVNILTADDVSIRQADGKNIIVINVPRARRNDRPVYVDGNPLTGTYRRNGEGDYRCTKEEVFAMTRDASIKTQDMRVLEEMDMDVFCYESVHGYRMRMKYARPGHVWEDLKDSDFLFRLGAAGRGTDGKLHPTAAGLLMFGYEYQIIREYPLYFLDYQEQMDADERWTDRIVSSSGDWSGNLYDFYFRVYNRIIQDIKVPFKVESGVRVDDTPVHTALREALANCLVNADYYGRRGLVIIRKSNRISFSNPGAFRIEIDLAKSGGISDPRNSALLKMFNMIDIGERAGSGIPNIYHVWKNQGWSEPTIVEEFEPERITLQLSVEDIGDKTYTVGDNGTAIGDKIYTIGDKTYTIGDKTDAVGDNDTAIGDKIYTIGDKTDTVGDNETEIKDSVKMLILEYLTDNLEAKTSEIAEYVGLKPSRTRDYLKELIAENAVVAEGANRNRTYRLKA